MARQAAKLKEFEAAERQNKIEQQRRQDVEARHEQGKVK